MTNLKVKLASGIATGAILANTLLPLGAFAEETYTVSGNGTGSQNSVTSSGNTSTTVNQSNEATVTNDVDVTSNTGNNEASGNTGGDVTVNTGNASSNVSVSNSANSNSAELGCCQSNGGTVDLSGNGANSNNTVKLMGDNTTTANQTNKANFTNNVNVDQNTGKNRANANTGGNVSVTTGDADSSVEIVNAANANSISMGGNGGSNAGWTLRILGNGTGSQNLIELDSDNTVSLEQKNTANFNNDVEVDQNTGNNEANANTGGLNGDGDVMIDTGDASSDVTVDNWANFNSADVSCDCLVGGSTKVVIEGNGASSFNTVKLGGDSTYTLGQKNKATFNNDLYGKDGVDQNTGGNKANANTAGVQGVTDPAITTGDADSTVELNNSANANHAGNEGTTLHFPAGFPLMGGQSWHVSFDWNAFLSWWASHQG